MAQKTIVTLVDDLDGSEAVETVDFGVDGASYQIDLSEENAERLRDDLDKFVRNARRTGGRRKAGHGGASRHLHAVPDSSPAAAAPAASQPAQPTAESKRKENKAIRAWARKNGYKLKDRGRIPANVIAAYKKAQTPATPPKRRGQRAKTAS